MSLPALATAVSTLLKDEVERLEPLGGGRNSRVYRVTCRSGRRYAAKSYAHHPADERDRLTVECSSLQFLRRHGLTSVPEPIASDPVLSYAVYEYIEGERLPSSAVTAREIDEVVAFLTALRGLCNRPGSNALPAAAEACFSAAALVECIERRVDRITGATWGDAPVSHGALHAFLKERFLPALKEIVEWCRCGLEGEGIPFDRELAMEARTLSPSDVGFHNALRRGNQLVFLDFEYFGWDDPAKLVADFVLHPAMDLSVAMKRRFVSELLARWDAPRDVTTRLAFLYPLYGLKWCMIFLNEFVPQDLFRRDFAKREVLERGTLQAEQLAKSQRMLDHIRRGYAHFPYGGPSS